MLGVHLHKPNGKFRARISRRSCGGKKHIGLYLTEEEAHKAWQKAKAKQIFDCAEVEICPKVKQALMNRYAMLIDDIENNRETLIP